MKSFDIPAKYRSGFIGKVKAHLKLSDPRKQNLQPAELDFGEFTLILPRHFGFCYGVENAIEIAYKAVRENPGKRIFLISQMIHNPVVNTDLVEMGIQFLMDTDGSQLVPWSELNEGDIVLIPAFGTTLEIEEILKSRKVEIEKYNTTCPFVEKVWKRSSEIGTKGYTVIIHGKSKHEETRATFSHASEAAPSIVIRNINEAKLLGEFVAGSRKSDDFFELFKGKYSDGFSPEKDLQRVGVVNQTTMLATETQEIADYFKSLMEAKYGEEYKTFFADTRDTLCYATNDNQDATRAVLSSNADIAIVIGGYNSSNTAQIHTILGSEYPSFFIEGADAIQSKLEMKHFLYDSQMELKSKWLPEKTHPRIVLTSGASCPDRLVDEVMMKLCSLFPNSLEPDEVFSRYVNLHS